MFIFPDKSSEFYKAAVKFAVEQVDRNCQEVGAHIMAAIDAVWNEHEVVSLHLAVARLTPYKMRQYYSSPNVPIEAFDHSFEFIRDELYRIAVQVDKAIEPAELPVAPIGPELF